MHPMVSVVLSAALVLTLQPAFAQSPGAATMPPGAQNPALTEPHLVRPPQTLPSYQPGPQPGGYQPGPQPTSAQPGAQPSGYTPGPQPNGVQPTNVQPDGSQPGPTPNNPAPSALIGPDDTGGLCQCLIHHEPNLPAFDETKMQQSCLGSLEACQAACQTDHDYSFVPHAIYTCPGPSGPMTGHIAMNTRPVLRLLSRR